MSTSADAMNGNRAVEQLNQRMLDRATVIMRRPDFAGYNVDLNAQGLHDNELRGKVVQELLKDKASIPTHLQDPQSLDAHLLEEHLRAQREALKAQQNVLAAKSAPTEEGSTLTRALQTIKTGMANVGSHVWRHKWKYLTLAALIGAGWYFSGYITPWLQQLRSAITQGAIDTGAAAGVEAAPVLTPAMEGASEGVLLNGQALHELPYAGDVTGLAPRSLIQPVGPPINLASPTVTTGNSVLSAFPGGGAK